MSVEELKLATRASEVPLLARIWQEDNVWNMSAFDLPIVAYGKGIEDARKNFEEAVESHLQALASLGRLDDVAASLRSLASERAFYEERMKPHSLVESFSFRTPHKQAA
jgi:predicted RNase H-like HicB family nuclease